jgi:alkanesulfonate monooxygenase SsuD/methylene tetrahydromethanopterin reductase-like flavin-dependent oxidoreductase (luciferase family)
VLSASAPLPPEPLTIGVGLYTGQQPPGQRRGLYSDAIDLAQAAEDAGFDAFWVSEHHGLRDGYLPAPLLLLAAVAARTRHIALGSGVVLAPLSHPLRLAEDAAVVDQLSNGRLILGLGLGYAEHEYQDFHVDRTRRGAALTDLIAFLRTAWNGAPFDWAGPCYRGTGLRVSPAPPRADGIPIWLGGYAEAALRRAGTIGDGYLLGRADPGIVHDVDAVLRDVRDPADPSFTLALNVLTITTDEPADEASARAGLAYQQTAYQRIQTGGIAHAGRIADPVAEVSPATVQRYLQAYGSRREVAQQVRAILSTVPGWSRVHVVLRILFPETDIGVQVDRLAGIGRDVLPVLRAG